MLIYHWCGGWDIDPPVTRLCHLKIPLSLNLSSEELYLLYLVHLSSLSRRQTITVTQKYLSGIMGRNEMVKNVTVIS